MSDGEVVKAAIEKALTVGLTQEDCAALSDADALAVAAALVEFSRKVREGQP